MTPASAGPNRFYGFRSFWRFIKKYASNYSILKFFLYTQYSHKKILASILICFFLLISIGPTIGVANAKYSGPNTISGAAPITGITIDHSLNLQFFARDTFGNIEPVKSMVYLMGAIPAAVTGINGLYNNPNVDITWTASDGADKYRVYRALSSIDRDILVQSGKGGYAPPRRLRYSTTDIPSGTLSFTDTNVMPGMMYYYGVTQVDSDGAEGVIGQFASVQIPETGLALNKNEAIARALAWLESKQDKTGFWGSGPGLRILATSQVLNAYKQAEKFDFNTASALFYLRGHQGDNNDFLGRKIIALSLYKQNVDVFVAELISKGYLSYGTYLNGWGISNSYLCDAVTSAIGMKAIKKQSKPLSAILSNYHYLKANSTMQSSESGTFGWIAGADKSIYVSSLVYHALDSFYPASAPVFKSGWVADGQLTDGSFGMGVIDTSAVILWINPLTQARKDAAVAYLISRQTLNGSWNNDPYITGLCLEALLN